MKIKSLLFILLATINVNGMDTRRTISSMPQSQLVLNKEARIAELKKLWLQVLEHTQACDEARLDILRYFPLYTYLTTQEIIILSGCLNHILEIPYATINASSEDICIIYPILLKLPKRKSVHEKLKKSSLKTQCLYALKNISVTQFNTLCKDLQYELVHMHGKKRIDLIYAYAKNYTINLRLARIINAQVKRQTNTYKITWI